MSNTKHNKISDAMFELSDIDIYTMVRNGNLHAFPSGFWEGVNGKHTADNLSRYLFEELLHWSIEDVKNNSNYKTYEENKLGGLLDYHFKGSYYLAIASAYQELKEWGESRYLESNAEHGKQYGDDELIVILQNRAKESIKELNRLPRQVEMHHPSGILYSDRFGSWEKALIKAGFKEDIYKDVVDTEDAKQLTLFRLKKFAVNMQRVPEKSEILSLISEGELKAYFKSYPSLIRLLTFSYSEEELKDILMNRYKKLNRIPTNHDIEIPFPIAFIDKFGSWDNALKESGIT